MLHEEYVYQPLKRSVKEQDVKKVRKEAQQNELVDKRAIHTKIEEEYKFTHNHQTDKQHDNSPGGDGDAAGQAA